MDHVLHTRCPGVESDKKKKSMREKSEELRCPYCDKIQTNKSSLAYHISTLHYFKCSKCINQFFQSQEELDLHFQEQHTIPQRFVPSIEKIDVIFFYTHIHLCVL